MLLRVCTVRVGVLVVRRSPCLWDSFSSDADSSVLTANMGSKHKYRQTVLFTATMPAQVRMQNEPHPYPIHT